MTATAGNQTSEIPYTETREYQYGRALAHPSQGDEIIISGLSGTWANCKDVHEFGDNLMNKVDMVTEGTRWDFDHPKMPQRFGKVPGVEKYDAGFFGTHYRQAMSMDPMGRMFFERVVEAIFDAGINPAELEGSKTAVFVAPITVDTDRSSYADCPCPEAYAFTGTIRSMIANTVSYVLRLNGRSCVVESACNSSLQALQAAYQSIRRGDCDSAIVGGTSICFHPYFSLDFAYLGVLGPDGKCKSFDAAANGYVRADAICVLLLQKAKDARRIYCRVVHTKSNSDGFKAQGISSTSGESQRRLFEELYQECGIEPSLLTYIEAHGPGTKVGDVGELYSIENFFCRNRGSPLPIGAVKSNCGHTEGSSGITSIAKVIISMELGFIPPNLHYLSPIEGGKGIAKGLMTVVTEKMPLDGDRCLIGINNFGFGGTNSHIVLSWNEKRKIKDGLPSDDLPRLVCVSGRTEEAISAVLDDLKARKLDAEFVGLLHQLFKTKIRGHCERGYAIFSKENGEIKRSRGPRNINSKPLYVVFGGDFEGSSHQIARDLCNVRVFAEYLQRVHDVLITNGIDGKELVLNGECAGYSSGFVKTMSSAIVQIGVADILKAVNLIPESCFGCGIVGELICGYFEGVLDLGEAVPSILHAATTLDGFRVAFCLAQVERKEIEPILADVKVCETRSYGIVLTGAAKGLEGFVEGLSRKGVEVEMLNGLSRHKFVCKSIRSGVLLNVGSANFKGLSSKLHTLTFTQFTSSHNFITLLQILGSLYEFGHNPDLAELYPEVQYPVSRGTAMISPLIKWSHSKDWFIPRFKPQKEEVKRENKYIIDLEGKNWDFLTCHNSDDHVLFPAAGYLTMVWETLAFVLNSDMERLPVVFEDVNFLRPTVLPRRKPRVELQVLTQKLSSDFKIFEGDNVVVSGRVYVPSDLSLGSVNLLLPQIKVSQDSLPIKKEDFYKELRVRGYNFAREFRRVLECDSNGNWGTICWDTKPGPKLKKWLTFIDSMFHLMVFNYKGKAQYRTAGIKLLSIDPEYHTKQMRHPRETPQVPAYCYKTCKIIRSGGIEIRWPKFCAVSKCESQKPPLLEKNEFVPNRTRLTVSESVRVNMQIVYENLLDKAARILEIIDDATEESSVPLSPIVRRVIEDIRYVQADIAIVTSDEMASGEESGINVLQSEISRERNCSLVVGSKILQRPSIIEQALGAVKNGGFVLSREPLGFCLVEDNFPQICIVTVHESPFEKLILFRRNSPSKMTKTVDVSKAAYKDFGWISILQYALCTRSDVIVYSQNEAQNGVLGLVNCLRCEPGLSGTRGVLIADEAPPFELSNPLYNEQLQRNLAINVYKDSQWGTYRYLLIGETERTESKHTFVGLTNQGGLSSLNWIQGNLNSNAALQEGELVHVYYTGINVCDVTSASGEQTTDAHTRSRTTQEVLLRLDFSGRNVLGERVFGTTLSATSLSTLVKPKKHLLWRIPEGWTMEDAATVPAVYTTLAYSLFIRCPIKKGQSILIHAGSGEFGFAAIHLAIRQGLRVYTTVSSPERKSLLKMHFPKLLDQNIGNSRDTTFEQMILSQTGGRGVDIVLNSLLDERLEASIRCLAQGGTFLNVEEHDQIENPELHLGLLSKEATFSVITLDAIEKEQPHTKQILSNLMQTLIEENAIKPIPRTVFKEDELDQAFRFMNAGNQIGKILVALREEEKQEIVIPAPNTIEAFPMYLCDKDKVYVIVGGLGGVGLELAGWLVSRGGRNIVMSSRRGVRTGYQTYKIKSWSEFGVLIHVTTADVTTEKGCEKLLKEASDFGEVSAIFNLAVVLSDAIFENQTPEKFRQTFEPKVYATQNLDRVSRRLCETLRDFVVFSSNSCGRGNAGQTNYGMANSIMERNCEERKKDGLPALAIQWGPILEVGAMSEMEDVFTETNVLGALQQKISSCLEVLDTFLNQKNAIVSSFLIAEKHSSKIAFSGVVDSVADILSIKDLKLVSLHATFAELGMDSITKNEVREILEQKLDVVMTEDCVRNLTFTRLIEIEEEVALNGGSYIEEEDVSSMLIESDSDEEIMKLSHVKMDSNEEVPPNAAHVILFPGIEGASTMLTPLTVNLKAHMTCLQYSCESVGANVEDSPTANIIPDLAQSCLSIVESSVSKETSFVFIAYSFGVCIAFEVAATLEAKGYQGSIFCIDSSPELVNRILIKSVDTSQEAAFQIGFFISRMSLHMPRSKATKYEESLKSCKNFEERLSLVSEVLRKVLPHSEEYLRKFLTTLYRRCKCVSTYRPAYARINSNVTLYKAKSACVSGTAQDYGLGRLCKNPVKVEAVCGNHVTMLSNSALVNGLNEALAAHCGPSAEIVLPKEDVDILKIEKGIEEDFLDDRIVALHILLDGHYKLEIEM